MRSMMDGTTPFAARLLTKARRTSCIVMLLSFAACVDAPTTPAPVSPVILRSPAAQASSRMDAENVAARTLAKQFASMRESRVTAEHKLLATVFLASGAGERLSETTTGSRATDVVPLSSIAKRVRPLEIYMPVRKHRDSWRGSDDILVAVQLEEADQILAYDINGNEIKLSSTEPPSRPVIAVVGAEADFSRALDAKVRPAKSGQTGAVGTLDIWSVNCDPNLPAPLPCDGPPTGGGPSTPPSLLAPTPTARGLWVQTIDLNDDGENWVRGQPEIEAFVHVVYPNGTTEEIGISGQYGDGQRYFDINTQNWTRQSWNANSEGMLLSGDTMDMIEAAGGSFSIHFWEDDKDARKVVTKEPKWWERVGAGLEVVGSVGKLKKNSALCAKSGGALIVNCIEIANDVLKIVVKFTKILDSADDELGILQLEEPWPFAPAYPKGRLRVGSEFGDNGYVVMINVD
jgi:hypothetical protein